MHVTFAQISPVVYSTNFGRVIFCKDLFFFIFFSSQGELPVHELNWMNITYSDVNDFTTHYVFQEGKKKPSVPQDECLAIAVISTLLMLTSIFQLFRETRYEMRRPDNYNNFLHDLPISPMPVLSFIFRFWAITIFCDLLERLNALVTLLQQKQLNSCAVLSENGER